MTDTITEVPDVGTVHHLDDRRPPDVPVQLVKQPTAPAETLAPLAPAPRLSRTRHAIRVARLAATDERTRAVAALAVRHGGYLVGGTRVVARRTWEGRTLSGHQRMIRAAEVAGRWEEVQLWEERAAKFRSDRHHRRMDMLKAPQDIAKSAVVGTFATAGGLLLLGTVLAIANKDVGDVLAPAMWLIHTISWAVFIGTLVWGPVKLFGPWVALFALWDVGRRRGTAPDWAMPAGHRSDDGAPITPSIVVTALRDLGIAPLKNAIKEMGDAGAGMLSPIVLAGCGVEVDATLPSGSSTEEVMNRRRKLAENLGRHEHEVYISVAPAARTVRLWIADSGALDEPIPASPLVTDPDMSADYKNGRAPWGQDLRGDVALISLYQKHLLITGLSAQGKTASLRALALWLALDPTVEFRVADLKGDDDWDDFDGLATVYVKGPTDDQVIDATEMVEDCFDEMQRRLMAPKGTPFHPLVAIVDEAQVAYGSAAVGKDKRPYGGSKATSRYLKAVKGIHDQGRAVSVTIWEGTQDPTDQNLPKRSREGNHIRASLAVGTESQSEMALGAKAVDGGAAPHKLRPGLDKGQVVVTGDGVKLPAGQAFLNVRTYFINDDDATLIADRAKALRSGVITRAAVDIAEPVDHLADILAVLGSDERVRTEEVRQRLAQLNPGEYREFTAQALTAVLTDVGAAPYKSGGKIIVRRERVLEALADRANDTEEGDGA